MAKSSVIGALRVMLGMDTAEFEKGNTRAQRQMAATERKFKKIGGSMTKIGAGLTASITAPVLGAAAAFANAADNMAKKSREIATAAQVAGEGFEEFQRQAHAASRVGIEFDKLGDIFKDVRDRVGDFAATGGGPMADFFENIGPKVGVTAEAFKGLSGKDALQLYFDSLKKANVSQEEMVFYLEALSSDATNLIPLLEKGGEAWERYGKGASVISAENAETLKRYNDAMERLGTATQKLVIAFVESGLLDTVVGLVERFAAWTSNLAETNPAILRIGTIVAGVAAVLGPFLVTIGQLVTWFAKTPGVLRIAGVALRALLGPVGLVLIAIEGVLFAWRNWGDIEAVLSGLYTAAKRWLQDRLGDVLRWVIGKIQEVNATFAWLYDQVVGNSHVPDMVEGIAREMAKLDAVMVDPARKAAGNVNEAMRDMASETKALLDRLFPDIAAARAQMLDLARLDAAGASGQISDATRREARIRLLGGREAAPVSVNEGPLDEARRVEQAADRVRRKMEEQAKSTETQTVRIAKSFGEMAQDSIAALSRLQNAIKGGGFLDILGSVINFGLQLGSTGLFGSSVARNINNANVPGLARGGSMTLGGMGGIDANMLSLNGTPLARVTRGENMTITPANDRSALNVTVTMDRSTGALAAFVTDQAGREIAKAAPVLINAGAQQAQTLGAQRARRRVR